MGADTCARSLPSMVKLGTIAFGAPAVHVAMLRDDAVHRRE
jgi:chromate transport protein ChrA